MSLGGSSAETEHLHKLLKDIETVMADKRVAVDHRAHGFKTCNNAGARGVGVGCMYMYVCVCVCVCIYIYMCVVFQGAR